MKTVKLKDLTIKANFAIFHQDVVVGVFENQQDAEVALAALAAYEERHTDCFFEIVEVK